LAKRYWLMKSEPSAYSFSDLMKAPKKADHWDGVRNYLARNRMMEMEKGDRILFYHSNTSPPYVAGIAEVAREAYPDHTALNPKSKYYDPKATSDDPRWFMVDVRAVEAFSSLVTLPDLKANPKLAKMSVVQRGQRASVLPVTAAEYKEVLKMGGAKGG